MEQGGGPRAPQPQHLSRFRSNSLFYIGYQNRWGAVPRTPRSVISLPPKRCISPAKCRFRSLNQALADPSCSLPVLPVNLLCAKALSRKDPDQSMRRRRRASRIEAADRMRASINQASATDHHSSVYTFKSSYTSLRHADHAH
jgi:hypothetical protein